jgi:DNA (cytosine-5)-methyltransferase 1
MEKSKARNGPNGTGTRLRGGNGRLRRQRELKAGALFGGIGGFCLAFEAAGFRTTWVNDADPYACVVYRHNFPNSRLIEKDIRKLSVSKDKLEPVDVLHAGFPCQSFSQAGSRAGFDDERGRLFFEVIRLINEFKRNKPAVVVLENAPYLKWGAGGAWFLEVTRQLQGAGYWFREKNAQELDLYRLTSIPQTRSRLFMVAWSMDHFKSGRFAFPHTEKAPAKDAGRFIDFDGEQDEQYYLPQENRYFKMISKERSDTRTVKHLYQLRKYFVRQKDPGVCPTLTANMGHGGHNVPFVWDRKGLRKLTEYECLKLQGFPAAFKFPTDISSKQRYAQIGNSVAPPVAKLLANAIKKKLLLEGV